MTADRLIRVATAAVVTAVASFAAVVSYSHIYDLGHAHGQSGTAARLLPLSVDGLILAASLVLLHEARNGRQAPALARAMLGLGVAATVAANVAYGLRYGTLGALISAWPAVAFIGAAEMAMGLVRRARSGGDVRNAAVTDPAEFRYNESPADSSHGHVTNPALTSKTIEPPNAVPSSAEDAARASLRATIAAGNPLSANQLQERFSLTRSAATKVRRSVLAESNGHTPE